MPNSLRNPRHLFLLLPALLILATYFPTLEFGKVWDDWRMLGDFGTYTDPAYWPQVLAQPLPFSDNYFRPLVVMTFVLEAYWGLGDFHSHLFNILLHGLNSALLIVAALVVWPQDGSRHRRLFAIAIGVLFGLHQVMSEGVVWLVGRFDLMTTTCFLLAIIIDATVRQTGRKAVLLSLVFLAGLLCKEMAVTLPVTLLLLHAASLPQLAWKHVFSRERIVLYVALTVALCVYFLIRYYALGYILTAEPAMAFLTLGTPLQRILLIGSTYLGYINVIFLPGAVSPLHYSAMPIGFDSVSAWLGLAALAFTVWLAQALIRKPAMRFAGLALLAMLASLMPVLHIIPAPMLLGDTYMADRAAIIPLVFLLLGVGLLLSQLATRKAVNMALGAGGAWLAMSLPVVVLSLPIWSTDAGLWKYLATTNPDCSYCRSNNARLLMYTASPEAALMEAGIAGTKARQPWQKAFAASIQADALSKLGRVDEALAMVALAEHLEPVEKSRQGYRIGRLRMLVASGRLAEAEQLYLSFKGTSLEDGLQLKLITSSLALIKGRPDIARQIVRSVARDLVPLERAAYENRTNKPDDWRRLGDMFTGQKNDQAAQAAYREAERLEGLATSAPAITP